MFFANISKLRSKQQKVMGTKNERKTKSYVTKEKNFKSVKGLQRISGKCILKNSQFLANISKLRPKQQKVMGTKNERKTKSYVTKEKNFKSVKGL